MNLKEIRQYFYNHTNDLGKKDFVVRIRKENKNNIEKYHDIIYYNGIKIFIIENNQIKLSPNIFMLNDDFIEKNKKDLEDKNRRKIILNEFTNLRKNLIDINYLKISNNLTINYNKSNGKSYQNRLNEVNKNRIRIVEKIKKELTENNLINLIDNFEENKCIIKDQAKKELENLLNIEYIIMNRFVNFNESIWTEPHPGLTSKNSGWKKPSINILNPVPHDITNLDKEKLNIVVDKIKGAVDNYLKISFEEEKYYQHQFMLNDFILNKFKQLNVPNLYRFEEEYYTEENNDTKNKGRVDTIFVSLDGKDIYLIELKVNDNVIGGTNGIHKHLIDIENLYEINTEKKQSKLNEFIENIKTRVNYQREQLDKQVISWQETPNIHFWTIIACEDNKMKINIINNYLDKYQLKESNELKTVKNNIEKQYKEYQNRVYSLNQHIVNLSNCDVRFYFDMIDYDRKEKIITIKDIPFELYQINNNMEENIWKN